MVVVQLAHVGNIRVVRCGKFGRKGDRQEALEPWAIVTTFVSMLLGFGKRTIDTTGISMIAIHFVG